MIEIELLIKEADTNTSDFIEIHYVLDESYPSGFVGVQGVIDDISGDIEVTLVSQYDINEDFEWDKGGEDFFNHEFEKVVMHELIHREQWERLEKLSDIPSQCEDEVGYFRHILEIEAYGRADMVEEMTDNGYSETLGLYKSLFGEDSHEVKSLISFYEFEIGGTVDNYLFNNDHVVSKYINNDRVEV